MFRDYLDLWGMYRYREDLFDFLEMPQGIEKEALVNAMLLETKDLELLYTDADFMKDAIGMWSHNFWYTWEGWLESTRQVYNPIENYNRIEWHKNVNDRDLTSDRTRTRDMTDTDVHERDLSDNSDRTRNLKDTHVNTAVDDSTTVRSIRDGGEDTSTRTDDLTAKRTDGLVQTVTETPGRVTTVAQTGFNSMNAVPAEVTTLSGQDVTKTENTGTQTTDNTGSQTTTNEYGRTQDDDTTYRNQSDVNMTVDYTGDEKIARKLGGNESNTVTYTGTDKNLDKDTGKIEDEYNAHMHGNIGVTTTQQMLREEREIVDWNIYEMIARHFRNRYCICVY